MAKSSRRNRRNQGMKRRTGKHIIDWVFVGDGIEMGAAYVHSVRHPEQKVIVVEPLGIFYNAPKNMSVVREDVFDWLERTPPESIGNIRDDFSYHHVVYRAASFSDQGNGARAFINRMEEQKQRIKEIQGLIKRSVTSGSPLPEGVPDIEKNRLLYAGLVKKVLIPQGRFIITTGEMGVTKVQYALTSNGFRIDTSILSESEIIKLGSLQAIYDYSQGYSVCTITGTKDYEKDNNTDNSGDVRRRLFDSQLTGLVRGSYKSR